MPILPTPDYSPPLPFRNGNLATLYPPVFRTTPGTNPCHERIETPDNDFLDMDWHACRIGKSRRLAIISHGLEGHSRKKYILGMARMVTGLGYDAACWTQRGCGKAINRHARFYHSGETDDLHAVVTHCLKTRNYDEIMLIGFSMGGNQILKYLGKNASRVPAEITTAATFSVPCDLGATERLISKPTMRIYFEYFMLGLRQKIRAKGRMFPDVVNPAELNGINSLRQFDDRFTAPLNGFKDAEEYYTRSSCKQFLKSIRIPTLLVNAQNDPFLPHECYPMDEAETNSNLFLEMPKHGGHVGFVLNHGDNVYWSENRIKKFLETGK
ncbi:MAG: alpha/beta fold hydrolase [Pseudodesulfovibrio sp.]|nr:alpha/beta fold hydrolase [Pseudodesulfovibrio sp.]